MSGRYLFHPLAKARITMSKLRFRCGWLKWFRRWRWGVWPQNCARCHGRLWAWFV